MPAANIPASALRVLHGRYRLLSELAKGGMGVTYRAWDQQSNRPVVVKIPKRALLDEPGFLQRFDREARATAALDHPHVVAVIEHGVDEGEPFLVLQFLPGGSLAGRIARNSQAATSHPAGHPAENLHTWLPGIAAALDHAHDKGVVHRDVKPANIFFDSRGNGLLGDFGIAKILEDSATDVGDPTLTATHLTLGTQAYMAPERFEPKAIIDGRADQYSLAVCVFEALAGVKPFRGDTMNIVVEHATVPPPDLAELRPDVPASCCRAVAKALWKRPHARFDTCRQFADAVLEEIPEPAAEGGFAWMLCPACSRLIRLPESAAGREGTCPRCKARLVIAHDLQGLWLPPEYSAASGDGGVSVSPIAGLPQRKPRPLSIRGVAGIAFVASLIAFVGVMFGTAVPKVRQPSASTTTTLPATLEPPTSQNAEPETLAANSLPALPSTPAVAPRSKLDLPTPALPVVSDPVSHSELNERLRAAPSPSSNPSTDNVTARNAAKAYFDERFRWVLVADPANAPDPTTQYGAVDSPFYIAQYEVTNADYCVFLNAVSSEILATTGIGDRAQDPASLLPAIRRIDDRVTADTTYEPLPGMATKPAVIPASDAIAFVNWLNNVHQNAPESVARGVYDVSTGRSTPTFSARAKGALFFIPTIDEWVKAAYYKGGNSRAGYWKFPTATSEPLVPARRRRPDGRGTSRGVETAANFAGKAASAVDPLAAAQTDVGSNGAPSAYGAFDMGGNVAEWVAAGSDGQTRLVACGGDFLSPRTALDRTALKSIDATSAIPATATGLRLARAVDSVAAPLTADPYRRHKKAATFRQLTKLEAAMGMLREVRQSAVADIQRPLKALTALTTGAEESDPAVVELAKTLEPVLTEAAAVVQRRQADFFRILPKMSLQQPMGNDLQHLLQFAQGLQARLDLEDLIARYDAEMEPIQREITNKAAELRALRAGLEELYGKP